MTHKNTYYFVPPDCDEPVVKCSTQCVHCTERYHIVVTARQLERYRNTGDYVQNIWPELDAGQREMIISGTHSDCFEEMFSSLED